MTATFAFPTTILFGTETISELRSRLGAMGAKAPLVVTDPGLLATNAFQKTIAALPNGVRVFSDIQSNPSNENVENASRAFLDHGCDSVIGLGGGSAIDVA